jgi:hypothetical protein
MRKLLGRGIELTFNDFKHVEKVVEMNEQIQRGLHG